MTEHLDLSRWVAPEHLEAATIAELQEWFHARPRRPIALEGFLRPSFFARLLACMEAVPNYARIHSLLLEGRGLVELSAAEWEAAPASQRFNRQDVAQPLLELLKPGAFADPAHLLTLREFFTFAVLGDPLRRWIQALAKVPIARQVSCELVRYHRGDYIVPHSDTHDNRIIGLNFYLGPRWQPGDGGLLEVENRAGERECVAPIPNSLSLLPIAEGCRHSVQAWRHEQIGRYTISMSFRPAQPEQEGPK